MTQPDLTKPAPTTLDPTHIAQQSAALSELAQIASESAAFYRDAAAAAKNPQLRTLFERMAVSKTSLAAAMTKAIPAVDQGSADSRTADSVDDARAIGAPVAQRVRSLCEELRARRKGRSEAYANHVREVEERQLKAFLSVMDRDIPMPVKNVVRRYLRAIHQHQDVVERGPLGAHLG